MYDGEGERGVQVHWLFLALLFDLSHDLRPYSTPYVSTDLLLGSLDSNEMTKLRHRLFEMKILRYQYCYAKIHSLVGLSSMSIYVDL